MHLTYSPVTGEFYRGSARVGSQHGAGYITLWHEGKQWLAHRLAYHMLGVPLPKQVDHANGVGLVMLGITCEMQTAILIKRPAIK